MLCASSCLETAATCTVYVPVAEARISGEGAGAAGGLFAAGGVETEMLACGCGVGCPVLEEAFCEAGVLSPAAGLPAGLPPVGAAPTISVWLPVPLARPSRYPMAKK